VFQGPGDQQRDERHQQGPFAAKKGEHSGCVQGGQAPMIGETPVCTERGAIPGAVTQAVPGRGIRLALRVGARSRELCRIPRATDTGKPAPGLPGRPPRMKTEHLLSDGLEGQVGCERAVDVTKTPTPRVLG
jgi:hypothetical protein